MISPLRVLILILSLPALANAAPPFRAAAGLFDLSKSKSLGLTAIAGETTQRFKGKGKRDGWQYPSSLFWKNSLFVAYSVNKEDVAITRIALNSFERPKRK